VAIVNGNPNLRISTDRLERQFRKLCRAPKTGGNEEDVSKSKGEKPFGFMYNLFFWAVVLGANDNKLSPIEDSTDSPFRWVQIPEEMRRKLEAIALYFIIYDKDPDKELKKAENFLSESDEEITEKVRVVLEQLANRGLELIDMEVETERPDAYSTVENLIETINSNKIKVVE